MFTERRITLIVHIVNTYLNLKSKCERVRYSDFRI